MLMKEKVSHLLVLFFLLCFYACGSSPYPKSLVIADSLVNVNPDSAIFLLRNMGDTIESASEEVRMYYQLLCIKANDKAYIPHTSDSLILSVIYYYVKKKDRCHLSEAYYYAGRVYRDIGDAPQALDYFEKAIDITEETDYSLKSRICSQIGTLFTYQDMHDEALEMFKEAYRYDILLKDSVGIVFDLRDMAEIYRYMNDVDMSLHYYQKAYELSCALRHGRLMNIVRDQMAYLYIKQKKYDLAKQFLQPSLNNLHRASKSAVYSIASKLYYQTGNMDSAQYYNEELLKCGTIYAKRTAHQVLAEIALSQNNSKDALSHFRQYVQYVDSIRKTTNTATVRKMRSLYNYQLREKENVLLKAENSRKSFAIIYILSGSFVLLVTSFAYLQYNKRRRLLLKMQLDKLQCLKEEQYKRSSLFIEENKKLIKELEVKLQNADLANTVLRIQLQKQKEVILYTNKQAEINLDEREVAQTVLFGSDIYNFFKEQIRSGIYKVTDENWNTLEAAINDTYRGFSENLRKLHEFSQYEFRVCLLIKINILPVDMAKFTHHTKEAISATRRRLYEKVFLEKGTPKQWDEFILSL